MDSKTDTTIIGGSGGELGTSREFSAVLLPLLL